MKRFLFLLTTSLLYGADIDLGTINIQSTGLDDSKEYFEDVFSTPTYIEKVQRLENAPSQKRLTTQEAMFIPGIQGDPVKAVQTLSGVTTPNDASGELFLYGSKPEESVTTIDHLPIGYLFHFGGLHSVISPEAIDQIDVYLGGFDVSYGNAMGGVLDITPKYQNDKNSSYVHLGLYDASTGINTVLNDKVSLYIGARRSYFDLGLELLGKSEGELNDDGTVTYQEFPNYYDATAILSYYIDDYSMLSFETIGARDRLEIGTTSNAVRDPEATGSIKNDSGFFSAGLRYRFEGDNYISQTLLYNKYTRIKTELFDDYYIYIKSNTTGLYHESIYEIDNHQLMAGIEINHLIFPIDAYTSAPPKPEDNGYDLTTAEKFKIDSTYVSNYGAIFLQDRYNATDNLTIKLGGRLGYSDYEKDGIYFDPRLSTVYKLNKKSNISISIGQYTSKPEGYKTSKELGNTNLTYEQADHYIIHYDYSFTKNSKFIIEPYYKYFKDIIVDDSVSNFVNGGKGHAYGIDTSMKVREGNIYAFLAYTYLDAKRQLNSNNIDKKSFYGEIPHTLQLLGSYKFAKNWVFSTLMKYHSGTPYTPIIGTEKEDKTDRILPIYGESFSKRFPNYFTLNLKIGQSIKFKNNEKFDWSFELMNITNRENISGIEYDDDYDIKSYRKQLPLLPWFDITYKF
jgi:hypothetical protein